MQVSWILIMILRFTIAFIVDVVVYCVACSIIRTIFQKTDKTSLIATFVSYGAYALMILFLSWNFYSVTAETETNSLDLPVIEYDLDLIEFDGDKCWYYYTDSNKKDCKTFIYNNSSEILNTNNKTEKENIIQLYYHKSYIIKGFDKVYSLRLESKKVVLDVDTYDAIKNKKGSIIYKK